MAVERLFLREQCSAKRQLCHKQHYTTDQSQQVINPAALAQWQVAFQYCLQQSWSLWVSKFWITTVHTISPLFPSLVHAPHCARKGRLGWLDLGFPQSSCTWCLCCCRQERSILCEGLCSLEASVCIPTHLHSNLPLFGDKELNIAFCIHYAVLL